VGDLYGVTRRCTYEQYDDLLRSGEIDAVYIALPNSMHADFAVRAARAGVHVLCEKPMAVTEQACGEMIRAARDGHVQLMIAYRLHFEACNVEAMRIARSGELGTVRFFSSVFSQDVKAGDIRLQAALGGGALYDIGVYCINAARYLFAAEPDHVWCRAATSGDPRFAEVDEMYSAVLHFPQDRLAQFTVSFGSAATSEFRIVGTRGDLRVEPAYNHQGDLKHHLTLGEKKPKEKTFPNRDQFGPQLEYFSECVLEDRAPEPSGTEGLNDVRIVRALLRSAHEGRAIDLSLTEPGERPGPRQEIGKPEVAKPDAVKAESPHRK
jgi:predicted dehydrogenase